MQHILGHFRAASDSAVCRALVHNGDLRTDNSLASHGSLEAAWGGQQAPPLPTRHNSQAETAGDFAAGR